MNTRYQFRCRLGIAALLAVLAPVDSHAQPSAATAVNAAQSADPRSVTTHVGTFNGRRLAYRAVAGNTVVNDDRGRPSASIFSVAYVAEGAMASPGRPVTFLYNGGPGSASFWIQMGALGPKIVQLNGADPRGAGNLPHPIVDNPDALLDVTDLVFIDPIGTGYSHALGESKDEDFYKTSRDASSISDFIATWLTENRRWGSPRFVGGESYGSIRTAMIVGQDPWMTFNGAILISQGLDWGTVILPRGYDLGYVQFLPSYAATAWYHGKIARTGSVADQVAVARQFAYGDYAVALARGPDLATVDRERMADRLAALTGIDRAIWLANDLRLPPDQFRRLLLAADGLRLGRFDTRFTTRIDSVFDERDGFDPSLSAAAIPYLEAMRTYLVQDLKVDRAAPYRAVTGANWTYDLDNEAFLNPTPHLGDAMRANPSMRLFVASGYYDFSSPVASALYNIGHGGIPMDRVTLTYYPSGHMMYIDPAERRALARDLRGFIERALPSPAPQGDRK